MQTNNLACNFGLSAVLSWHAAKVSRTICHLSYGVIYIGILFQDDFLKVKKVPYLCSNQVQHRVKRCKSAVAYSVYLNWGQSIIDWYTADSGKGSISSLSARTGDGLQIEFATRFVFSPKLCVRCFESCQAVRPLKTSPRTRVHLGRFRGAWAAEWSCFICTNRRTEVVSAVLGPMGEEIAGPVSDTLRHDLLLKLNILL